MPSLMVRPPVLKKRASDFARYSRELYSIEERLDTVKQNIQISSSIMAGIASSLSVVNQKTEKCSNNIKELGNVLETCAEGYSKTENNVCQSGSKLEVFYNKKESSWYKSAEEWALLRKEYGDGSIVSILKKKRSIELSYDSPKYTNEDGIYKHDRDEFWKKSWARKNGQSVNPDTVKEAKKKGTLFDVSVGGGTEESIYSYQYNGKYGEAGIDVGKSEAHWSVEAGMYAYDKDGNKKFAPAVSATAGMSVTALAAHADAELGDDNLGLSGHGELSAGKLSVETSVDASLFSKDGKINPEVKISGSAEAIAAEAKGSVSGSIAGVKGTVSGSVNVGVGAHADFTYADGVVKFDFGASVGLGVSLGGEIDTKPLIEGVCSTAETVLDWAKAGYNFFFG